MRPLNTETIHYEDITLTVGEATVRAGMVRSRLKLDALGELGQSFDPKNDLHLMRVVSYPDVMGALVDCQGLTPPASFEEFLALPDALVTKWIEAAYRFNPHWLGLESPEEAAETRQKKSLTSSSGSSGRKRHKAPTPTQT